MSASNNNICCIISSEDEKLKKSYFGFILNGFFEPFHRRQILLLLKIEKDEYPLTQAHELWTNKITSLGFLSISAFSYSFLITELINMFIFCFVNLVSY